MDSFELFQEFRDLLQTSNLSARTIQKCVTLLYENMDYHEELYDALIQSLKESVPSRRLQLFYLMDAIVKHSVERFVSEWNDPLLKLCTSDNQKEYIINEYFVFSSNSIMLNLREIIDSVVDAVNRKTDKNGGCGNIGPVRKILGIWRGKDLIEEKRFEKLDKYLSHMAEQAPASSTLQNKEAIWRRMEDDRDRQKKAREDSWVRHVSDENAVFPTPILGSSAVRSLYQGPLADDSEFLSAWEKARIPSRVDYELFQKLNEKLLLSRLH